MSTSTQIEVVFNKPRIEATNFIEVYCGSFLRNNVCCNTLPLDIQSLDKCLRNTVEIGLNTIAIWKIKAK